MHPLPRTDNSPTNSIPIARVYFEQAAAGVRCGWR
jgi:hypothetical protein